jgi:hypothetical protein
MRRWSLSYTSQDFALKFMKRGIIDSVSTKTKLSPCQPKRKASSATARHVCRMPEGKNDG